MKRSSVITALLIFSLNFFSQNPQHQFHQLDSIATAYKKAGKIDSAIVCMKRALQVSRENKLERQEVQAMKGVAEILRIQGHLDEAIAMYAELEPKALKAGMAEVYAASLSESGVIYWRKNDRVKTMDCFQKALAVFDTLKPSRASSAALVGMGFAYTDMKQQDKAKEVFLKAIPIYKNLIRDQLEAKDYYAAASTYLNLGSIYKEKIDNDSASRYLRRAVDLAAKNNYKNILALAYSHYGSVCALKNQAGDCETFFLHAIKIYDELHNQFGKVFTLSNLFSFYSEKGDYQKMEPYIDEAIRISEQTGDSAQLRDFCLYASITFEKKKDFQKAYTYRLRYEKINERLYNAKNAALMNEMLVKYEADAREKENQLLQKQNQLLKNEKDLNLKVIESEKHKNWLIIAGGVLLLLLIFFILRGLKLQRDNYSLKVKEQEVEMVKLKEMKTLADLKTLQARINPHFLYNSLNSITSLIHERPDEAEEMTIKLAKLFRYSINTQEANWSTVSDELSIVETYLDIERVRFGERIQFTVSSDESLLGLQIPRFLLQPMVENALKHGLKNKESGGILSVNLADKNNLIEISVHDNGTPFPPEMTAGYGLQSINDKLNLLYGNNWRMDIINDQNKRIIIELPKKQSA